MTTIITKEQVMDALANVKDPELQRSLTELKMVRNVEVQEGRLEITLAFTMPNCPFHDQIESDVRTVVMALPGVEEVVIHAEVMTDEERKELVGKSEEGTAAKYNHIQQVVAVMSGKGGVGKSLVTSLLAVALVRKGYRVGILDADITGPSIPMFFGLQGQVDAGPVGFRPLLSRGGIKIMSMNFLLESEDQPVIWRGPLIGKAITQLWGDVMWGNLDYLLVDLPPGTSDASLSTMQSLPVKGILMVTTPQRLANMIVRKAVHMAQAVGVSILGVVENMAYFICPDSGKQHFIFGPSHSDEVVMIANAPLLAQIPISPKLIEACDAGRVEEVELAEMQKMFEAFMKTVADKK